MMEFEFLDADSRIASHFSGMVFYIIWETAADQFAKQEFW